MTMKLLTISTLAVVANWAQVAHSIDPAQELLRSHSESSSRSSLLALHKGLITHESISGNEESVGKYLAEYLESKNFTVEIQEVEPRTSDFES